MSPWRITRAVRHLPTIAVCGLFATVVTGQQSEPASDDRVFRFRTGVELVNVTATVTDNRGRFVAGLQKDDFRVFDDGVLQTVTHFSNERVPVSLGIVLDTSGSMEGEKMRAAERALDRFLFDLMGPDDEFFLYRFSYQPVLVHGWTTDRDSVSRAMRRIRPRGGTALFDAVAEAVLMAEEGRHRKKAVVVISDGNDTNSETGPRDVQKLIRNTEVLVYAIGIDGRGSSGIVVSRPRSRPPIQVPFPIPGGRGPTQTPRPWPGGGRVGGSSERVNASALRSLTDDSGGRTEIIRDAEDLDPATAGVADELSKQYYLAYPAPGHGDGAWHAIDVEVPNTRYRVRARRGYVASR